MVSSTLINIANNLCPMKDFHITRQRPEYFTSELVEYIKERDTVLRLAARKKDQAYWKRGIDLSKKVVRYIKEAKSTYITEKFKTYRKDSKKYWKSIQLILPNSKTAGIEVIYDPNSDEIVGGTTVANVINNYFADIGENLAGKLPNPTMDFWPERTDLEFIWDYVITAHDIIFYSKDFCPS